MDPDVAVRPHLPTLRRLSWILAGALLLGGGAFGAPSGTGSGSGKVGKFVEITVTDSSIAAFATFTPVAGSETVRSSTTDFLRFSNAKTNIQSVWDYSLGVSFTQDATESVVTTTVSYQGATTTLTDLVYLSELSTNAFTPWKVATATDLTSEGATGWTNHAGCGTMVYQGSLSIPYYDNSGVAQTALTRYYRVCDSATEFYLGTTKDLSAGDFAKIYTTTSNGAAASAANYEVTIQGNDYIFISAASATTVTLRMGVHVPHQASQATNDVFMLMKFPDGFPAGDFTATVTATASGIVT